MLQRRADGPLLAIMPVFLILLGLSTNVLAVDAQRPFTVRDSIEMTRVVNFWVLEFEPNVGDTALYSPDGKRFVILTRRGDIDRNVNVESLLSFRTEDVKAFLRAKSRHEPPAPQLVAQVDVRSDGGKISKVRWLNNNEIGFIAEANNRTQAFVVTLDDGHLSQITHASTDVLAFDKSGDTALFFVVVDTPRPSVIVVGDRPLFELLNPSFIQFAPVVNLFRQSAATGEVVRIEMPNMRLDKAFQKIWISPRADYAVAFAPAVSPAEWWSNYRVPNYIVAGARDKSLPRDPTLLDFRLSAQLQLVDLRANTVQPLIDAPSGWPAELRTPLEVFWPDDGESVIVSNTYLPLTGVDSDTGGKRQSMPAIAEVQLRSRAVTTVAWVPAIPGKPGVTRTPITAISWDSKRSLLRLEKRTVVNNRDVSRTATIEQYQKRQGAWRRVRGTDYLSERPIVQRRENVNERPIVWASDAGCGCTKQLFDPAPHAREFTFGRAENTKWKDRNGIEWEGQLVFPPDYVARRRYPLVVQTHGFNPAGFLIDGNRGTTTAMAAQPLANSGIVVLQVDDNREAKTLDHREAKLYADGYHAGIEALVERGIADGAKVGLIAFSRTGLSAVQFLADNPDALQAVTIADAAWWGYLNDLLSLDRRAEDLNTRRNATGGNPWEIGLETWIAQNPLYKLPSSRAVFRLEANGPASVLSNWEYYAVLRNTATPVDFLYFPEGGHQLMKPAERLASQGGNVDWFRFWLQHYQDADPAKAAQYRRWRALRERRDALAGK